ncbi:hypothetical protein LEL_10529 [Akanthomyces lecanii RCEF 1005]|uniref:Uncharacterized protein n=1 Tax=Akanthomyces lecanii RCEF 1005 TaxID=1081108 RepID=A0A162J7Y6_CORDF|nr:hypothetical protein LEL_10529 [Akanthomyces lecanii RCEF 1005]
MPYRSDTHVLTVDVNVIHKVDTANPANLYSICSVFSRCANTLEQGRRLENLSWRLWQREQLVDNEKRLNASAITLAPAALSRAQDLPQLSSSTNSLVDEDAIESVSESACPKTSPIIHRLDSTSSLSRRDQHVSSGDFKNMVVSIIKDTALVCKPIITSSLAAPKKGTTPNAPAQTATAPTIDMTAMPKPAAETPAIMPSKTPPCFLSDTDTTLPEHGAALAHEPVTQKEAPAKYALGGSCSADEQCMSVEMVNSSVRAPLKQGISQIGDSSRVTPTKTSIQPAKSIISKKIKQVIASTSRSSQLEAESAIDSDTDVDHVGESAIDDDDSSDWEDSAEESGKSSVDDKFFQRVESKANLVSRPSLITLMVAQNERQKNLSNQASHSASPNDSDEGPLMMKGIRPSNLKPIIEVPRSSAQPTETRRVDTQAAFSPRTTRRNMLATELTESLRRHLLWERQQKTSTANAVLKRRHTSHDVANLKQFPEKPCLKKGEHANAVYWNQYFDKDAFDGYHSKGW